MDQDPLVGKAILQHLEMLQTHPKTSQSSLVNTCERLCKHWRGTLSVRNGVRERCCAPKTIDTNIH